jgi:phage terminase large subunit-like protein
MLESGMVWYPEDEEFAQDLVEECAAFPNGSHDDQVDATIMALMRFRQGNFISLDDDDDEEKEIVDTKVEYY